MTQGEKKKKNWNQSAKGIAYRNKHHAEHYDRINFEMPKGFKQEIKNHAEKARLSVNAYIVQTLRNYWKKEEQEKQNKRGEHVQE